MTCTNATINPHYAARLRRASVVRPPEPDRRVHARLPRAPITGSLSMGSEDDPARKPYSVLLLYPDDVNDGGAETYYAFVEALDPVEAVAAARREAVAAQADGGEHYEPDDFAPLLVIAGHHFDQAKRSQ